MASEELVVAVVGRNGAGKTTLLAHLAQELTPNPSTRTPPQGSPLLTHLPSASLQTLPSQPSFLPLTLPPPPGAVSQPPLPPPLFVRNARAAFTSLLRRLRKLRLRQRPSYSEHILPAPSRMGVECSAATPPVWRVVDTPAIDLSWVARAHLPHVFLYVTRLDDSRAMRADRLIMSEMHAVFGSRVWQRTILVLTHGHSLPPQGLSDFEFLRGRRDMLWRLLSSVAPPTPRRGVAMHSADRSGSVSEELVRVLSADMVPSDEPADADGSGEDGSSQSAGEVDAGEVEGSDSTPHVLYDDIPPPTTVVVELAESCPVDDTGAKVLRDGTPWMPELLAEMQRVACASPSGGGAAETTNGIYRDLSQQQNVGGIVRKVAQRGSMMLVIQFILADVLVRLIRFANIRLERRENRIRSRRSDVICELSDEEYRRLTTKTAPDSGVLGDTEKFFFGANEGGSPPLEPKKNLAANRKSAQESGSAPPRDPGPENPR